MFTALRMSLATALASVALTGAAAACAMVTLDGAEMQKGIDPLSISIPSHDRRLEIVRGFVWVTALRPNIFSGQVRQPPTRLIASVASNLAASEAYLDSQYAEWTIYELQGDGVTASDAVVFFKWDPDVLPLITIGIPNRSAEGCVQMRFASGDDSGLLPASKRPITLNDVTADIPGYQSFRTASVPIFSGAPGRAYSVMVGAMDPADAQTFGVAPPNVPIYSDLILVQKDLR
ncbi:hypothetical protein [uncultured Tateyamaria sp.]|uniref:hypothetical protein n=1 Tax=uncultured Tateyamaria sp. TaxID=455651 RepID=UPI002630BB54|nr:hypothetical protein [uncultured Tateyamaria sp.]